MLKQLFVAGLFAVPVLAMAQDDAVTSTTSTSGRISATAEIRKVAAPAAGASAEDQNAIDFLSKLEAKNENTKALRAEFSQVRVDSVLLDEVKSEGKFQYKAPNQFHATYQTDHSSEIWMTADEYIEYIPSLNQVDILPVKKGEDAPISQLLLGFGVKVDEIRKLFEVHSAPSDRDNSVSIRFVSKDLDRTMNFTEVTVEFDQKTTKPRTITLVDDQSTITLKFKKIDINPDLKPETFEPKWPEDVEVRRR